MEKYNTIRTLSVIMIVLSWISFIGAIIIAVFQISNESDLVTIISPLISGFIVFVVFLSLGKTMQLLLDLRENQIRSFNANEEQKSIVKNSNTAEISDKILNELFKLIKSHKKSILGKGKKEEIIGLLEIIVTSEEQGYALMAKYNSLFGNEIINDLKSLSTNYLVIKEFLDCFIKFNIVLPEYPHDLV
ncbi:MAG: hypothetical protein KAT68_17825 [Bacteroidales bacterium]|nr:hypothetical protein [Bacteroidales bacterium]